MDQHLLELAQKAIVTVSEAVKYAENPAALVAKLGQGAAAAAAAAA
ncbi:hypothetical protein HQ590_14515 [bacterium]|nr:hypothetical protein [bacterium]